MNDFKKTITITLLILSCAFMHAQVEQLDELAPFQLKSFGKNAERLGDYYTAIVFFEKYHEIKPTNQKINYILAELYRKTRNYEDALELYKLVSDKALKKYPLSMFYHAQMLKSTGKYDEAIEMFDDFRREFRKDRKKEEIKRYRRLARNEIEGCEKAMEIISNPLKINIERINNTVNGPHVEFSPIPRSPGEIIYASLQVDSLIYFSKDDPETEVPVRQFYVATKQGNDWIGGQKLEGPFNIEGVETGNGAFSKDGNRFYFTRCGKNWQNKTICELYVSHKHEDKWQKPVKLEPPVNDPNYTSTQPTVTTTAKYGREIVYFVSDRPGGKGGLDIWYTTWRPRRQAYTEPRNLGLKVNSKGDEMSPFYDNESRHLYFSSTGHPGLGGYDVFKSKGERRKWEDPENVGFPVNTSYDDLYYTIGKNRDDGFFVSNRPGGNSLIGETCCDDIYYFKWTDFIYLGVNGIIYPLESGKFSKMTAGKKHFSESNLIAGKDSVQPLEGAIIALYMKDEETDDLILIERDTTGTDGKYFFNLLPDKDYEFAMEGFQYFNEEIHLSTDFITFSDTFEMPPIWVNILTDKPIVLENIYYEFDKYELTEDAKGVLDTTLLELMQDAKNIVVEVSAHTDSVGNEEYNLSLSQQRAESVAEYIASKGIDPERLIPKGYGSSKPVAPNFLPDGSDNPEGREKNRRTEFRVVGTLTTVYQDEEFDDDY